MYNIIRANGIFLLLNFLVFVTKTLGKPSLSYNEHGIYTNKFAVKINGGDRVAREVASELGFEFIKQVSLMVFCVVGWGGVYVGGLGCVFVHLYSMLYLILKLKCTVGTKPKYRFSPEKARIHTYNNSTCYSAISKIDQSALHKKKNNTVI